MLNRFACHNFVHLLRVSAINPKESQRNNIPVNKNPSPVFGTFHINRVNNAENRKCEIVNLKRLVHRPKILNDRLKKVR